MRTSRAILNEAGTTFVEMAVVVTVLGLLAVAVVPIAGTYLQDTKARAGAEQVAGAFRQARTNALATAATYTVLIGSTTITTACTDDVPAGNRCPPNRAPNRTEDIIGDVTLTPSASPFLLGPTGGATLGNVQVHHATSQWEVQINLIGGVKLCTPSCT
jgi:Tfp pilus assembly protein FimT